MIISINRDSDAFDNTTARTTTSDYYFNTTTTTSSSGNQSTMTSSRESYSSTTTTTTYSRLSFDTPNTTTTNTFQNNNSNNHSASPENLSVLKPHRSSDPAFEAIVSASNRRKTSLTFHDFKLNRKIGSGDIGTVYLCRLRSEGSSEDEYAMKVVDKEVLKLKNKIERNEMEKKILKMVDHPFLPTLYAEFDASNFSCIVMEYCSGGDLHSLRHKLPAKRFSVSSARFYAAEVLVALEYLHMLGIIYRDLKPENVLVRSDGHIMLSDFDLSLCSHSIPAVQWPTDHHQSSFNARHHRRQRTTVHNNTSTSTTSSSSSTTSPTISFSCLPIPNRRLSFFWSKKIQSLNENKLFVAEPISAKSSSFVGTHEYVSPEVASGRSHGNAVDWWSLGIFIYEMIYGQTPFVGPTNESTLRNILKKPLTFPKLYTSSSPPSSEYHARDLISQLLDKDPVTRLGSKCGAAEVKTHPFFKSLNFALVRSMTPPAVPGLRRGHSKATPTAVKEVMKKRAESFNAFDYF